MDLFSWSNPDLYFLIVLSILNAVMLCFLSYKFMQIIQLSNYNVGHFGTWLKDTKAKWVSRVTILSFLSFCCVIVTNILFNSFWTDKIIGYAGLLFYFSFMITFILEMRKIPQKKPLKITKRMFRLYITSFILYLAITFGLLVPSLSFSAYLRGSVITLVPILIPVVVPLACIINYPIEKLIFNYYKKRCKKVLQNRKDLIRIGITGSYGKTSTKIYLAEFLKAKYKVCYSPSSFNTPMGIAKTVLNDLKKDDQIVIAEMGATRHGDIKELCDIVNPNAGIITSVGPQHLETFKTLQNIVDTKSELFEALNEDDFCIFNISSDSTKEMYKNCKLKNKIAVCGTSKYINAKNIIATENGLLFTLCYKKEEYSVSTNLLGEHNVQNILSATALALNLGISIEQILQIIPTLKPAEHRLELKKLDNNILLIDDSFNSNIQGTAVALKTLSLFEAKRKIVVTPGLVELGKTENAENVEFGKRIAKVADIVILVNKNQSENLKKGLLDEGFSETNIIYKDSLFEVTELFKTILQNGEIGRAS